MVNVASQELKHAFDRLIRLIFKLLVDRNLWHFINITFFGPSRAALYTPDRSLEKFNVF